MRKTVSQQRSDERGNALAKSDEGQQNDLPGIDQSMMGRESRIVELKAMVNELSRELGREEPFSPDMPDSVAAAIESASSVVAEAARLDEASVPTSMAEMFHLPTLQASLVIFAETVDIAAAVLDLEGNVLADARWQRICTKFHRTNETSCRRCVESDTYLANQLGEGQTHVMYRCRNGLTDAAAPVIVDGRHVANAFVGQFLTSPPDEEYFRKQAAHFGFDEADYLAALHEVPVVAEDRLPGILRLLTGIAELSASMASEHLQTQRLMTSLKAQRDQIAEQRTVALSLMEDARKAEAKLAEANGKLAVQNAELDRRVAERTALVERQSAVLNAINHVLQDAINCKTEKEVAEACLNAAQELTGSRFGFIGELNAEGTFDTIALTNPGWTECGISHSDAEASIRGMQVRGIWGQTILEGHSEIVNDPGRHPSRVGIPKGHPQLTSFLGVPLLVRGRPVGTIALANKEGGYDEYDQKAVEALAVPFYEALLRKRNELATARHNRLRAAYADFAEVVHGQLQVVPLCRTIIQFLCARLPCQTGLLHVLKDDGRLHFTAGYAYKRGRDCPDAFAPGEGLVGQAVLDRQTNILNDLPPNYVTIGSGLGETPPVSLCIKPVCYQEDVPAVVELGSLTPFNQEQLDLLDVLAPPVAATIQAALARAKEQMLFEETQRQAEELQAQQEELRTTNEELEEQAQRLRESDERLRAQHEEMEVTNEELKEKNELLQRQKMEVETARREVEKNAQELAQASKYKSEFLSNMSHELRTPLNSLLILAQDLVQNRGGNLTEDQVESAQMIHSSGSDLLDLINEILDLSKIEAGRMDLHIDTIAVESLASGLRSSFAHVAADKGLDLSITVATGTPAEFESDRKRVEQILRNLLANALKFTERGSVSVSIGLSEERRDETGTAGGKFLAVAVTDTGIGIAPEQQSAIFVAFQQADGSTSRKYGGTGLGLSISKELATLLGGEIQLESEPGKGSTFTLFLPLVPPSRTSGSRGEAVETAEVKTVSSPGPAKRQPQKRQIQVPDDRDSIVDGDSVILVVEDDPKFARVLYDTCMQRHFKSLVAGTGEDGLALARKYLPVGILLDIQLPGMDGWAVLAALKEDIRTRHIPVHVVSVEEAATESLRRGAIGHVTKPIDRNSLETVFTKLHEATAEGPKRILLVDDDDAIRRSVRQLIAGPDVEVDEATSGNAALEALRQNTYACVILDLGLPDMEGGELLRRLTSEGLTMPPVVIQTAQDLSETQAADLSEYTDSIIIKDVRSQERLLDEVSLFLHRMVSTMPEQKKQIIRGLHETDALLEGKKILIVDDDMRTTFALSKLLAQRGARPLKAANGEQALKVLDRETGVDLVLMDIMMPVMDGYTTMGRIREQEQFRKLPIIALTAKAMPEDRKKCVDAGASDYLTKPVDQDRLISMLRVWLYR